MKKKLLNSLRVLLVAAGLGAGASAWAQINTSANGKRQYVWTYSVEAKTTSGTYYLQTSEGGSAYINDGSSYGSDYTVSQVNTTDNRQIYSSGSPDDDKGAGVSLGNGQGNINIYAPIVGHITVTGNYAGRVTIVDKSNSDTKLYTGNSNASKNAGQSITTTSTTTIGHRYQLYAAAGMGIASVTITEPGYGETMTAPSLSYSDGTLTLTAAGTSSLSASVTTYYTTDGSIPTSESTELSSTAEIGSGVATIKAVSISEYGTESDVVTLHIDLTTVSTATTWDYAMLKAAQTNGGFATDGTIWVKNMTDDSGNSRLKFASALDSEPTAFGDNMISFKTAVAGQVYMRLVDYKGAVSVYDGTTKVDFNGGTSGGGGSQQNSNYHGGNTYYKYATFQAEAGKQYYIYCSSMESGGNNGVYFINFQPTNTNTTTALAEETTWNFTTQNDILTEFHGITKDNLYFGEGLTDEYVSGNKTYRLTYAKRAGSTSDNVVSFKLPGNTCGKITIMPSCYYVNLVLTDGTNTLRTFVQADHNQDVEIPITTTEEATLYLYPTSYSNSQNPGVSYITWTPITAVPATVGANGYTTFASPYALDLTDANRPAGLKAYKATLAGTTLTFTALNQTVPAGTGLLLLGETKGGTYNITVVASGDAVTNALVGVTSDTPLQSTVGGTYYFVMKKATTAEDALAFAPLTTASAVTIPAGKAYVALDTSAGARSLTVAFDDETTGIKSVLGSELMVNGFYNLNGQRVESPTKGLYIMNGKKVILK